MDRQPVYCSEHVAAVNQLHAAWLAGYPAEFTTIQAVLDRAAMVLHLGFKRQDPRVCVQLSNWHPRFIGAATEVILAASLTLADARHTLAREHGFRDWDAVLDRTRALDQPFERAVDLVVGGQEDGLIELLSAHPHLTKKRSAYGHGGTLVHYLAANGVETWRQIVPANGPKILNILLAHGADVTITASLYGGHWTALELLGSSAHPAAAGTAAELTSMLRDAAR